VANDGEPRVRRTSDFVTAAFGLVLIIWAVLRMDSIATWEQLLTEFVQSGPSWANTLLEFGYALGLIYVVGLVVALVAGGRERRPALRDLTIVGVGAVALTVLLSFVINQAWPYVLPEIGLDDPSPTFPVLRVAVVTSILMVVSPHVTRPLRRLGWLAIFTTAIASIGLSYGTPSHVIGSFGVGLLSAGLLLVIAGSPRGYPDPDMVTAALASLGVLIHSLDMAPSQTWGVIRFVRRDETGDQVDVKVYGRDAFDSQLAAKLWHTLWYRETSKTVSYSRLEAVEHEALMTFTADRAGMRVPDLAAVGSASAELSLISFRGSGASPLPGDSTDDLLVETWAQVRLMHEKSLSHGSLHASSVRVSPDGRPIITDFALGSLAAEEADQGSDVAELLFSTGVQVGEERAVRAALEGLGRERLVDALPYFELPAITPTTRRLTEKPKKLMSLLSSKVAELTGAEIPEPVKLRRITVKNVVSVVLLLLVASTLIPLFTGIDYAEMWGVLQSANWGQLVLALIVGHLQFFPQATSTMFAVPATLPLWPLLVLQTASQFISLAIPSAAGRIAMNTAFLCKFGVSVTAAVAQGSIDGFSGFLVQAALLVLVLIVGDLDLDIEIDTSEVSWLLVLGVVVLVVVVVVEVVLHVKSLRERVVPVVSEAWALSESCSKNHRVQWGS
jgi:glycosyltransferase 2 family protein